MSQIKSGDRIKVSSKEGQELFQAFALEDFDTEDQSEKTVQARTIGEVGTESEMGELVNLHIGNATIEKVEHDTGEATE